MMNRPSAEEAVDRIILPREVMIRRLGECQVPEGPANEMYDQVRGIMIKSLIKRRSEAVQQ